MAVTTNTGSPELIEQGGTYLFTENFSNFPNTNWTAQYLLQIPGSAPKTINASNASAGTGFLFTLNTSDTTNWSPGRYTFSIYATERSDSQRATAKTGVLNVIPDLSQTQVLSTAAQMLAQVETAITNLSTGGFTSVSVNNVSYTRADLASSATGGGLLALRTKLQAEVIREQQAQEVLRGINHTGIIGTRFK